MAEADDSDAELERQRAEVEADFHEGWVPDTDHRPRALSVKDYRHALKIMADGLLTGMDPAIIRAVRDGARPGDLLPPPDRMPYIVGVSDDAETIIRGSGVDGCVAVLFSHQHFPGSRFGHRFPRPSSKTARYESIWLKEQIETGALHRMMQNPPATDEAGIIWTTW